MQRKGVNVILLVIKLTGFTGRLAVVGLFFGYQRLYRIELVRKNALRYHGTHAEQE